MGLQMTFFWVSLSLCVCLEMTASEPLSIEEELAMQKAWREDDKSTRYRSNYCETAGQLALVVPKAHLYECFWCCCRMHVYCARKYGG